ncbi:hypothetical protein CCM_07305 [Cordyceps militaris CM01]|uniref:Uncharacterized protein n=1 Tax=Cordyceps militaris (strain CM01) TaxID=983644 RepID=G3JPK4_CORMM|nr:uncharacterized protein CCM_07305 [Cordyceps militaris CM01]EGX89053.1 hypothetical protein CCM_07305 [Cordyceps militaris CM01]
MLTSSTRLSVDKNNFKPGCSPFMRKPTNPAQFIRAPTETAWLPPGSLLTLRYQSHSELRTACRGPLAEGCLLLATTRAKGSCTVGERGLDAELGNGPGGRSNSKPLL